MLVGPRQSGKTTLLGEIEKELIAKGERTVFLNLDIESDRHFFQSQSMLIQKIKLEFGQNRGYVFIDEIQRKEDAGLFLKGIYDSKLPYKFIVSGSGSLELKEKIQESLTGRKQIFELTTVSIEELINYRTDYRYEARLEEFFEIERQKTQLLLEEHLSFGGYPRVITEDTIHQKKMVIDEIFRSYIERDVTALLKAQKVESFSQLIRLLSSQIGGLVNLNELSTLLGISLPTLKNYLWYGEKTFVINRLPPFFKNIRKEIVKTPVYYFHDIGLRNYVIGMFGNLSQNEHFGYPFENLIFNILKMKTLYTGANIRFWRTKDKAEVDFIIDFGIKQIPIEVKYTSLKKIEINRSLMSFIKKYSPPVAFIVNLSLEEEKEIENTKVKFIKWWRLLLGMNY